MKAGRRLWTVFGVAALALAAAPTRAQEAPPPQDTPADESIGPRELENFSIDGTVTRQADPPPANRPAATPPRTAAPAEPRATAPATQRATSAAGNDSSAAQASSASEPVRVPVAAAPQPRTAAASSVTVPLPPIDSSVSGPAAAASEFPDSDSGTLAPGRGFSAWPWLLAAIALALGGLFLWRSRARHALAGYSAGPQVDAFVAPEPRAPLPRPSPAPRAAPPATAPSPPLGVVSTRLRPRIEFAFTPLRCMVDEERVVVEFELELINSGSAPARGVLIEASMFNAGPSQDQAIGAFFANPVGQGERIPAIAPLKRMTIRSQVAAPRANVSLLRIEGREMFVPLIAFNALYGGSGADDGQTSLAYLVGRDTKSDKLAPFRLDRGPRQFEGLGARQFPAEVRH